MPVACVREGDPSGSVSQLLIMELVKGADYVKIQQILSATNKSSSPSVWSKQGLKGLLSLSLSENV